MEKVAERVGIGTIIFCLIVIAYKTGHDWLASTAALVALVIVGLAVYFLPSWMARGKKDAGVVFLINLFFGVTFIGWFVALIWAMKSGSKEENVERARDPKTGRFLPGTTT